MHRAASPRRHELHSGSDIGVLSGILITAGELQVFRFTNKNTTVA